MLKQTFDYTAITRVLTSKDVWRWNIWKNFNDKENSLLALSDSIKAKSYNISPLKSQIKRNKPTYQATDVEDAISIKLLDRYIRRIYKVRQSDRGQIIKQVATLLKDSGDYYILRLDIEKCYESMEFSRVVDKLNNDMILDPNCLKLLNSIFSHCNQSGIQGLPRGLAISPTLSELYLEPIDKFIKQFRGVIYYTRYVDDLFILIDKNTKDNFLNKLKEKLQSISLYLNNNSEKKYIEPSRNACFDYLGYSFEVIAQKQKANQVNMTISAVKLNKIKQKIAKSFSEYKKTSNFSLLKQRLNYLTVIKVIKKSENGILLGGIAYNYRFVSDQFKCLRKLDGFLNKMINTPSYAFSSEQISTLSKVSFYGSVSNKKQGKFSKTKAYVINQVWKNV